MNPRRTLAGDIANLQAAVRHLGYVLATPENLARLAAAVFVVATWALGILILTHYLAPTD